VCNDFAALPAQVPSAVLDSVRLERTLHLPCADLHLTLAFFGREDTSRIPALKQVLSRIQFSGCLVTLVRLLLHLLPQRFTALSFELKSNSLHDPHEHLVASLGGRSEGRIVARLLKAAHCLEIIPCDRNACRAEVQVRPDDVSTPQLRP